MEWNGRFVKLQTSQKRTELQENNGIPFLIFGSLTGSTNIQPNNQISNQPTNQTTKYSNNPEPAVALLPEYHHVGGSLGEGDDEAGDPHQDDEGQQEVGTATAAGPGPGRTRTVRDAPTVCEVL